MLARVDDMEDILGLLGTIAVYGGVFLFGYIIGKISR